MQLEWFFRTRPSARADDQWLAVGARRVRLCFARHRRARRYVLRLRPDGAARVTVPRGGSIAEAREFAERNVPWLERQLLKQAQRPVLPRAWLLGTEVLFRGEPAKLEAALNDPSGLVRLAGEVIAVPRSTDDLRPAIERHLRLLATTELPPRVFELAARHQLTVRRVSVRNQRSRWGSCSRHGTISLNWRLVQTPIFVRDYIILHELAHLRQMNHSRRFWREVAALCPGFREAEAWLKSHSGLLAA